MNQYSLLWVHPGGLPRLVFSSEPRPLGKLRPRPTRVPQRGCLSKHAARLELWKMNQGTGRDTLSGTAPPRYCWSFPLKLAMQIIHSSRGTNAMAWGDLDA